MESVRVQLSGKRIKANGRIVAAATATNPAFAAYYDLLTDETGATKRLGMTVTSAERERQLVVARDNQNIWLVTDHRGDSRSAYDGALDVDVVFSPFFNALPIRRLGLTERADTITVPTIYISLPEISIISATSVTPVQRPGKARESRCIRRCRTPFSRSTPTGSSWTIPAWQCGSDHPAGATGGRKFAAPILGADEHGDDLRPGEAVVSGACGVPTFDKIGYRVVVGQ